MVDILIADDHQIVRVGYQRLFELSGEHRVVAQASDGQQAVALYKTMAPDLLVIDVMMPGPSIVNNLQRIINHDRHAWILVVSMHDNLSLVERCFKAGALGYITKSSEATVLLDGLAQVSKGKRFVSPDIAERMALNQLNNQERSVLSLLTQREFDVFLRLAKGQAIADIADEVHLSSKTISNYASKIKKQLSVSTTAELVHLALQENLLDHQNAYE